MNTQLSAESRLQLALDIRERQAREAAWARQIPAQRLRRLERAVEVVLAAVRRVTDVEAGAQPTEHEQSPSPAISRGALAYRQRPQHGLW